MLVVSLPLNEAFQEHLTLCLALRIPFVIVVTKIDIGYRNPHEIILQLETALKAQGCSKKLVLHTNNNDEHNVCNIDAIPLFLVSCVTGEGLGNVTNFIKDLLPTDPTPAENDPESCLFQIDETFRYFFFKFC